MIFQLANCWFTRGYPIFFRSELQPLDEARGGCERIRWRRATANGPLGRWFRARSGVEGIYREQEIMILCYLNDIIWYIYIYTIPATKWFFMDASTLTRHWLAELKGPAFYSLTVRRWNSWNHAQHVMALKKSTGTANVLAFGILTSKHSPSWSGKSLHSLNTITVLQSHGFST